MATHFRGPLLYDAPAKSPLAGLSLDVAQAAFLRQQSAVIVGNGNPYLGPATAGSGGGFVLTEVATGAAGVAANNIGRVVLTTGTADEDNEGLQFIGMPFRYVSTRNIYCFGRFNLSVVNLTDFAFGLYGVDTSLVAASAIAVDNGIGFFKPATATDLTAHVRKATVSTTQAMGLTLVDNSFFCCGFTVIGGLIRFYAALDVGAGLLNLINNDNFLGSGIAVANTNAPDNIDTVLTFMVGQEGGTTARVCLVDWAFACEDI